MIMLFILSNIVFNQVIFLKISIHKPDSKLKDKIAQHYHFTYGQTETHKSWVF